MKNEKNPGRFSQEQTEALRTLTQFFFDYKRFPTQNDCPKVDYLLSYRKYLSLFNSWSHTKMCIVEYIKMLTDDFEYTADESSDVVDESSDVLDEFTFSRTKWVSDVDEISDADESSDRLDEISDVDENTLTMEEALKSKEYVSYEYYDRISIEDREDFLRSRGMEIKNETVTAQEFDEYMYEKHCNIE